MLNPFVKKCNKILNVALIIFGILSTYLLIDIFIFNENGLLFRFYIQLLIIIFSLIFLVLILFVLKNKLRGHIFFDFNENFKLEINSKKSLPFLKDKNDINYSENYIITDNMIKHEIDNYFAFKILNLKNIQNIEIKKTKIKFFESDPDRIVDKILKIINEGVFISGIK